MFRRVPRPLTLAIQLTTCVGVVAVLSLLPSRAVVKADDSEDRSAKRAEVAYAKTLTIDVGRGVKMEFVLIPPGKFMMGSPNDEACRQDDEVQHDVEITRPFYLAKYPTTQEQYEAITRENPSFFSASGRKEAVVGLDTKQFPVEWVSWNDAQACCSQMTKNDSQGRRFCLPTEAEWEYACRARTSTPFHFGAVLNGKQDNCKGDYPYGTDQKGHSLNRTTKVGSYLANAWGLYDMHGNVYQWCEDYYGPYAGLSAKDPLRNRKHAEDRHVYRGGSCWSYARYCRAASRAHHEAKLRCPLVGFRVVFRPE